MKVWGKTFRCMFSLTTSYFFYRMHDYYKRWDGNDTFRSAGIVALPQSILIGGSVMLGLKLYSRYMHTPFYSFKEWKGWYLFLLIMNLIISHFYYKDKFPRYEQEWGNEPRQVRRIKVVFIVAYICLCVSPLFLFLLVY